MNRINPAQRLAMLFVLTTAISGSIYLYLRNVVAYRLPISGYQCGGLNVGSHMDSCIPVDNTQVLVVLAAMIMTGCITTLFISLLRGVSFKEMFFQWNEEDGNDSPSYFFIAMTTAGLLMTAFLGVSNIYIMLFTAALRLAAFFFVGTIAAMVLNFIMRGSVDSLEGWIARFESSRTNGPMTITILGYLIGLVVGLCVL